MTALVWTKQADGSYTEPTGRLKIALWKQTRRYRLFEGGDGNSYIHTGSLASCKQRAETLVASLETLTASDPLRPQVVCPDCGGPAGKDHCEGCCGECVAKRLLDAVEAIPLAAEEFQSIDRATRQAEPVEIAVPSNGDLVALVRDKERVAAETQDVLREALSSEPSAVPTACPCGSGLPPVDFDVDVPCWACDDCYERATVPLLDEAGKPLPVPAVEQRTKAKKLKAGNASEPLPKAAKPKAVDVQEAVNKLVLRHGRNVHEWADWPELLTAEGVDPAAVTDRILQLARDAAVLAEFVGPDETEAENLRTPDGLIWSLEPIYEEWAASSVHFWPSECGRYRLCRITDNDGRSVYYGAEVRVLDRWDAIGHSPLGPGYPKKHDSLEAAAKAALKYHCDKYHLEGCPTNADELLASVQALVESLEGPPEPAQPDDEGEMMATKTKAAKAETLKVPELAARKLLTALGSEGAAEQDGGKYVWSRSKLLTSLKALPSDRAECDPVSGADAELLDRIEAALKGGGQVEVVPEGEEEKAVETKTKKASKPKAAKKEAQPARNGKASGRPKVLGAYSAGPFARWLGRQGVGAEDARRIMEGAGGCPLSDASLKWELKEVREAKPPAPVSREHAKELKAKWPEAFGARKAGAGK